MGFEFLRVELDDIRDACDTIHWWTDQDDETLLNALDGDSEREEGGDSGGAFWRHQEAERVRAASDRCGHWWFTLLAKTCLWLENASASPENGVACLWSKSESLKK